MLVLSLGRLVLPTDQVTISYYDGEISTSDGSPLTFFEEKPVDNLLTGSAPVVKEAKTASESSVLVSFSKSLASGSFSEIKLILSGETEAELPVTAAELQSADASKILLTASAAFKSYNLLKLKYADSTIQSADGGALLPFEVNVENLIAPEIPALDSAILDKTGYELVLYYNQMMGGSIDQKQYFTIKSNDSALGIKSMATSGKRIIIRLNDPVAIGAKVTLNYSGGHIQSANGILAAGIENLDIENKVILIIYPEYIQNVTINSQGASYELAIAAENESVYTDRTYGFTGIPEFLKGAEFIRWSMGLKSVYANPLLSFTVNKKGKLYIAHDNRIAKLDWLKDNFTQTSHTFTISDATMTLYEKSVESNVEIKLGANQVQGAETGSCSNYVALFVHDASVPTGVESFLSNSNIQAVTVFPNPASNFVTVECVDFEFTGIRLINLSGNLVYAQNISPVNSFRLQLPGIPEGLYFLEVYNNMGKITKKIIIRNR